MNRKLKIALAGVGLVAATGIGASLVMAQGSGACEHGPHMMRGAWDWLLLLLLLLACALAACAARAACNLLNAFQPHAL